MAAIPPPPPPFLNPNHHVPLVNNYHQPIHALQHLIQQPQQQANAYNAPQYQPYIPPPQYQQEGEDVDDLYGEGIRHRRQKFRKSRKPIRKSRKSSRKSRKSRRVKRY